MFGRWLLKDKAHLPVVVALVGALVCSLMLLSEVRHESQTAAELDASAGRRRSTCGMDERARGNRSTPARAGRRSRAAAAPRHCQRAAVYDRRHAAGRPADGDHAGDGHVRSSLVAIYAIGYMHGDRGYWRFFSYIGLFVFSMTMLVSVSNFVLLYVFWEAVGLCSYLLIGFWYRKARGRRGRQEGVSGQSRRRLRLCPGVVPDLDDLRHAELSRRRRRGGRAGADAACRSRRCTSAAATATAICLLLMLGACGKSAQFPLHVWLPDAMEGPTPVSALIHAATMVTAGVYMVTRCTPLFLASPDAQHVVAIIGAITAALGGIIALTQTDLKRVLAYSTISQLGYMFLGLGAGTLAGITAGMFHLFTHAFFKALLFLAAGSVMHAMGGVIDMRRFGGLRRLMPDHALDVSVRLPGLGRRVAVRRLLEQGRDPGAPCSEQASTSVPLLYDVLYWVGHGHGLPDRDLHVPRVLPDVLRPRARFRTRPATMPTSRPAR